jgi:hypothetical protein
LPQRFNPHIEKCAYRRFGKILQRRLINEACKAGFDPLNRFALQLSVKQTDAEIDALGE